MSAISYAADLQLFSIFSFGVFYQKSILSCPHQREDPVKFNSALLQQETHNVWYLKHNASDNQFFKVKKLSN